MPNIISISIILILIMFASYMVGSISGGIIVGKLKNIDIRKKGSNNAGATNALRTMGIPFALIVLIIDVYKGYFATYYIPIYLPGLLSQFGLYGDLAPFYTYLGTFITIEQFELHTIRILAAISAILGHVYPLYFKFKGGKGVGTALGTLFVIMNAKSVNYALDWNFSFNILIIIGFIFWISSLTLTGFVGLSSIIAGISISLIYLINNNFILDPLGLYSIIIALFFIFTHRTNISRMLSGKENQFKKVMLINLFKKNNE